MDILDNPTIKQLLEKAESTVRMLGQVDSYGKRQVKDALNGVYEDIGKHVHALARQIANGNQELVLGSGSPITIDELEDLTSEIENTDEMIEDDPTAANDLSGTHWIENQRASTPIPVSLVEGHLKQVLLQIQQKREHNDPSVAWVYQLENLLDMLDMSEDLSEDIELAVETNKLQWATTNMYDVWASYPRLIQVALTGMLACRAHVIQEQYPASLATAPVLKRLKVQQVRAGLRPVLAMEDSPRPEDESWSNDATLWWNILVAFVTATA
jgi:hypothetical protein